MPAPRLSRPEASEYAAHFQRYLSLVPEGDILQLLEGQVDGTAAMLADLTDEQALSRYAPGKWSIKEVVSHIIDTERIFVYRALRFSRGDPTLLPGFEQDDYVAGGNADRLPLTGLLGELKVVREGTLAFFRGLDESMWARRGTADGNEMSVRAIPFILVGHERHHASILSERYLDG